MVYDYDNAIVQDLRNITHNDKRNIYIIPPEDYFDLNAMMNKDNIKLPLISLTRPSWSLLDRKPQTMIFDGFLAEADKEKDLIKNIQAIPISISYQLDIWTNNRKENDMIMRELIWYYTLNPTLCVNIPYKNIDYPHEFNIFFDNEIEDNSDIVEHKNQGRLFRQTIGFYTDDAYLWKIKERRFTKLDVVTVEINDREEEVAYVGNQKQE